MSFFVKQKTAYEMRISDWSSDVCSSDLGRAAVPVRAVPERRSGLDRGDGGACGGHSARLDPARCPGIGVPAVAWGQTSPFLLTPLNYCCGVLYVVTVPNHWCDTAG